jgi:heme/copper-type cytochrome/quinol oxidase subunit 3
MTDLSEEKPSSQVSQNRGKMDVYEGVAPEVKVRTKKMMMWFIIFAIVMMFGGITSALIVLYGKLIWIHITPPTWFWYSNIFVVISSLAMIIGINGLKKGNKQLATICTVTALLFGIAFTYTQNQGWGELSGRGMGYTIGHNDKGLKYYRWNTLGKFSGEYGTDFWFEVDNERVIKEGDEYYKPSNPGKPVTDIVMNTFNASGALLSVLIYLHIIHLFFGLIYLAVNTVRLTKGRLNQNNWVSLSVNGMYWHFMGILWLYLFAFIFYIF